MKRLYPILFAAALCTANLNTIANPALPYTKSFVSQDERTVKNFNGVAAGGPIEVIITLGNTESIKFEGDAAAIATLVTEVKGNILIIRPSISWKSWAKKYEGKKITAHVTAKNISSLTMSGDGSILVKGTVTAAELATTLSGSGSIKATIDADELATNISGSGSLELNGKADEGSINISGSGRLNGKMLAMKTLNARISGSGSVYSKVSGTVNAFISGSGHVYYNGNPSIEQKIIGSGGVSEF